MKILLMKNIVEPYMSFILSGQKTIEGRLNYGKFKDLEVGDVLHIGPDEIKFTIERLNVYRSFREMIQNEGIENVVPDKNTIDEAVEVYYRFYTKEQEEEFGALAIGIKLKL